MATQIPISGLKNQVSVTDGTSATPSVSFSNDPNTGLYRAAEDTLAMATGGIERLRIDASGHVRIPFQAALLLGGEANGPNQAPSTDGVRVYTSNVAGNSDYLILEKTDGNNTTPDGGFLFQGRGSGNAPAEYLRIKPISPTTAYVGIGTTDPTTDLHVEGDVNFTGTLTNNNIRFSTLVSGTPIATTSGTSIPITGIPSWVKRITLMLNRVSTNGTDKWIVQLGTANGYKTSGYTAYSCGTGTGGLSGTIFTTGFGINNAIASREVSGIMTLCLLDISASIWTSGSTLGSSSEDGFYGGGSVTLSAILDRIRLTTLSGTNAFDHGSLNILYE